MDLHKPKAVRNWRELASEIGIIVVGVLIALTAEQVVQWWHWQQKVESAHAAMDQELGRMLSYSIESSRLGKCADPYVDALEAAILKGDSHAIDNLRNAPPFAGRPWRSTAWQSAMSTQVADHLKPEDLKLYAYLFTSVDDIRALLDSALRDFAEATAGRIGGPRDASSIQAQITAAEKFRQETGFITLISQSLLDVSKERIPVEPAKGFDEEVDRETASCVAAARDPHSKTSVQDSSGVTTL